LPYEAAVALAKEPGFAGVGFVFAPDDGLAGIDLDHARNPDTGEIASWAQQIVDRFASYTEVSPSGTGLHIIVRGAVTAAVKKDKVEIYDRARYFTVTGDVLGNRNTIVDAPKPRSVRG
jgi:putative DNA primase/helicase